MKTLFFLVLSLPCFAFTTVTFTPVDRLSGQPFMNASYGSVEFFARKGESIYYPNKDNAFTFSSPGTYNITGESVYNFCYPGSVLVEVTDVAQELSVYLPVDCE